ncbi:extracellular solute-binding protein [Paenibacillus sp. KQZ6P-2]|uniref:Extracellular solute-binding protein n=1 Tax=Paenibacillus mangrovi TaxID=2931978 RepID=A0A9X2B292_9BACL|nr:extracellular solute-binding protein [Paenibacillus mangrovi]MCJ8012269.1 extracellular solute-binding protein [Paenibacillus mangrovi]
MANKKGFIFVIVMLLNLFLFAACASQETGKTDDGGDTQKIRKAEDEQVLEKNPEEPAVNMDENLTLKIMLPWGEDMLKERVTDTLYKKYPNIKLELLQMPVNSTALQELNANGIVPDIMLAHDGLDVLQEMDMAYPLDDMIEKSQYDLTRFRGGTVEAVRARDPEGKNQLLGLPAEDMVFGLFYNKEIFDKFGVKYPTDGMTWDEVIDLAKKLTAEVGGVKYRGINFLNMEQAFAQLSATGTNPATGETQFSKNPAFANFFDLLKRMQSIPGNYEKDVEDYFQTRNVAMQVEHIYRAPSFTTVEGLKFDMVSFPTWPDKPGVGPSNFAYPWVINKHSEHKEQAFKVIECILSDENQLTLTRIGVPSPLADTKIREQFGAAKGLQELNLNLKGVYSMKDAEPAYSPYGPETLFFGENYIRDQMRKFLDSNDDIQTYLRKMDDEYAAIVTEKKEKQ